MASEFLLRLPALRRENHPIWLPEVELGTDAAARPVLLVGRSERDGGSGRWRTPNGKALDDFIELATVADAKVPEAVLEFARLWGVLGLCPEGTPGGQEHGHDVDFAADDSVDYVSSDDRYAHWWSWERLDHWRTWSKELLAIVRAAQALQSNATASTGAWPSTDARSLGITKCLSQIPSKIWGGVEDFPSLIQSEEARQRSAVVRAVETWVKFGGVQIEVDWCPGDTGMSLSVRHSGLAGLLAADLLERLTDRVRQCAGCGLPVKLRNGRRRPADNDENVWCDRDTCGPSEKKRQYLKEQYKRPEVREARRQRYLKHKARLAPDSQTDSQR